MLPHFSIRTLYPLALAEGEGVGTAYEYYAKRQALARWLKTLPVPRTLLIAGLPEKYGSSLDFLQLAQDLGIAKPVVVDDRADALQRLSQSVAAARKAGALFDVHPEYIQLDGLNSLTGLEGAFDLCLGSEVLQRMDNRPRNEYFTQLCGLAPAVGVFAPNGENRSHTTLSGLSGIALAELRALIRDRGLLVQSGYVDMPPFPPGLTRSAEQRAKAAAGRLEALAMAGLGCYARLEGGLPEVWRRSHAHIVYGFVENR
jgi:hypothetical protein